jgi:ribonuclease Z
VNIILTGTGSPIPDPNRAGPSTVITTASTTILVDAGRAVVMRLAACGIIPPFLSAVVLTHLHSDHICDLNDVVTTHWVMTPEPTDLHVYGPKGTAQVVDGLLSMLASDIHYRMSHHADLREAPRVVVHELTPGEQFFVGDVSVLTGATDHRPVEPSLGYRFTAEGVSTVVAGDGVPCAGLDELVRGADAYVQTVVREDLVRLVPRQRFIDILDYHSTVGQAAQTAQRGGVRTLVLTHFVPTPALGEYDEWRALAADFDGVVVTGDDLTSVSVTPHP